MPQANVVMKIRLVNAAARSSTFKEKSPRSPINDAIKIYDVDWQRGGFALASVLIRAPLVGIPVGAYSWAALSFVVCSG